MNPFLVLKTIVFVWLFTHDIGIDDLLSYLCLSFFVSLSLLLFSNPLPVYWKPIRLHVRLRV